MTKRKEPTKTLFEVTIEKTVTMRAHGLASITARLDSTKKKFLSHSAQDIEDHVGQDAFYEIGDWKQDLVKSWTQYRRLVDHLAA